VAMNKWLAFTCFVLAVLNVGNQANAQFTDARNYDNTPIVLINSSLAMHTCTPMRRSIMP
jgi:hypothetical protein